MNTNKSIREYRSMTTETLVALAETTERAIKVADAKCDYRVGDAAARELKKIEKALEERF